MRAEDVASRALLDLAFARPEPDPGPDAVREAVARLLAAGADPGASYRDGDSDFTALTGVLGGGEGARPPHPQARVFATALLEAGASANDPQALYDGLFDPADDRLGLLLAHGLDDADELSFQLGWAVWHGFDARVRLLLGHGVDPDTRVGGRYGVPLRPAYAAAVTTGQRATADLLVSLGASPTLTDEERAVGAVFTGEPAGAVDAAVAARPGLVAWAAATGDTDAVRRAVERGWSADRRARTDVPSDQEWETGLHAAAMNGDLAMVRTLLGLGADPGVTDARFGGTPLQWAQHGGHPDVVEELSGRSG